MFLSMLSPVTALFVGGALWAMAQAHPTIAFAVSFWLFSNIVSAMPSPRITNGTFYAFLFNLGHGLAGSLPRILAVTRANNLAAVVTATNAATETPATPEPPK